MSPNQPKTKNRVFRIPDEIYDPAREAAANRHETLTSVVVDALTRYVEDHSEELR